MPVRLTARARRDIEAVLEFSVKHYGEDAAIRYATLVTTAIENIGDKPFCTGSREITRRQGIRAFALANLRLQAPGDQRVSKPVHQLIYRLAGDGFVEIVALVGSNYPAARVRPAKT